MAPAFSLQPPASSQVYSHVFGGTSHMGAIDKTATAVAASAPSAAASASAAVIGNIAPSFAAHKLAAVVTATATSSITQYKFKCVAL